MKRIRRLLLVWICAAAFVVPPCSNGTAQAAPAQGPGAPGSPASDRSRVWNAGFLRQFYHSSPNSPISFELVGGEQATGVVRHIERGSDDVIYLSGEVSQPEKGRFFFQKQKAPGKAGDFVGVVELPARGIAYRLEPIGAGGAAELVERPLESAVCTALPPPPQESSDPQEIPPLEPDDFPDYPIPDYQDGIIPLQSLPGAVGVVYIDYRGGYTPTWGGITYEKPNVSNAQIRDVWKRVAEDFMCYNINVTTDIRVYESAREENRQRCVVTPTTTAAPGAGGVAYLDSWNWTGDTPCWAFYSTGKNAAEVISHEVGHTLTLGHDGQNPSTGYYGGHGSGAVGWAPIMGVGYSKEVVQWSRGEYSNANNTQDDLAQMVARANSVGYRADDTGPVLASARWLEIFPGNAVNSEGVIERAADTDAFKFTTAGGTAFLRANPVGTWANLAIEATLYNSSDVLIASNNPQTTLWASLSASLPAGTYTFRVKGAGRNDPVSTGFSAYGSLGYYSITGSVAGAFLPDRLRVAENATNGTFVGWVAPLPSPDPRAFAIVSGNTSSAFAIDSSGRLTVANSGVLNYETLGANRQLPVQFDLLVNVTNLANPNLTELNRRVVVAVTDANDRPTATGFGITVLEGTPPGTLLGSVKGTDADFYSLLNYSVVSGDPDGLFTVNPNNGEVRVAGPLVSGSPTPVHQLQVRVSDQGGPVSLSTTTTVAVTVQANRTGLTPGSISYAVYPNITGNLLSGLTSSPSFPNRPGYADRLTSFEAPTDRGDNYGSTIRGYLIPPISGYYLFYIASDDNSELWLSPTSSPSGMARIAYVSGDGSATAPRQWNKYTSQRSSARLLTGGTAYYIEARHKEGGGGDNLAVAWTGPGITTTNVIPGVYLAPYDLNYIPTLSGFSAKVRRDAFPGARIGQLKAADANGTQDHTYAVLSGDDEGVFSVGNDGWVRVVNAERLQNSPILNYVLNVRLTDNGSNVYTADAAVFLEVVETNATFATTVSREMFLDIGSATAVSALTSNAKYPRRPDRLDPISQFSSPIDVAENYGSRIRALLTPPISGDYRFYVASDDASQLRFSMSENPGAASVIASVSGWTDPNVWNTESTQTSPIRPLVAGQRYYLEVLHKEGGGGDHVSVAWLMPGAGSTNIIDAAYLTPVDLNYAPLIANQAMRVFGTAANGTYVGRVGATDSPVDRLTFQIAAGNTNGTFAIEPDTGVIRVANNTHLASGETTVFPLTVQVQDSGYDGVFPLQMASAQVTVSVQDTNAAFVWTGGSATNQWSDAGNWGGAVPPENARLIFGVPAQLTNRNDVVTDVFSVQITNHGFALSGSPVRIQAGLSNAGSNTWNLATTLAVGQSWNNSVGTLTVNGPIDNGGNNLTLSAAADIILKAPISGAGGLSKSGAGRLVMAGAHTYSGPTIIATAGAATALEIRGLEDLDLSSSDLTLSGRMDLYNHSARIGALSGNGVIFANNSIRTLTVGANNHSGSFSGSIQDSSGAAGVTVNLVKTGTSSQTLGAANSYSGVTVVEQGVLSIANSAALGTAAEGTTVLDGGTLGLANNLSLPSERFSIAGAGALGGGSIRNDSGVNTLNGGITLLAPATIRASAGRLNLGGPWSTGGNPVTLDVLDGANIIDNAGLAGSGGLVKTGAGPLNLNGIYRYTGPTEIREGTLIVGGLSAPSNSPNITVSSGAILDVNFLPAGWVVGHSQSLVLGGTVRGHARVLGTVSGGAEWSAMTFASNAVLAGNVILKIGKAGGVLTNDQLVCGSELQLGGTLTVTNAGTEPLALGDAFPLFVAASRLPGIFTSLDLAPLPQGLTWDASSLAVDGILRVASATLPAIEVSLSVEGLTLSWPEGASGYALEGQTNAAGFGLTPEWFPVPGVTNNRITLPIETSHGSTFYRLRRE